MRLSADRPIPAPHRTFLERTVRVLSQDERLVGVAICGSHLTREMDEYSDLDLVVVVDPRCYEEVMGQRRPLAESLGAVLSAFSGEHVGEPRLFICLYDNPLLHVDLKFVTPAAFPTNSVEVPEVLWERGGVLTEAVGKNPVSDPVLDLQWIEDRYWTWIHCTACAVGRGELFGAFDAFAFLQGHVLGPMAKASAGLRPHGVRHLERDLPQFVPMFRDTMPCRHEAREMVRALFACVHLYRRLRHALALPQVAPNERAEEAVLRYLGLIAEETGLAEPGSRPAASCSPDTEIGNASSGSTLSV